MTAATTTTIATSTISNRRISNRRPVWRAATMLKWAGYSISGIALFGVLLGWGLWALIIAVSAALVGAHAAMLADELGLPGALRGVRIKNLITPIRLSLPYYTRLRDVAGKRSSHEKDGSFAVTRDGIVIGILSGTPDGPDLVGATTVEARMQPISWVEAVDADEDAFEALRRMKQYRRSFLPVIERDRLVGVIEANRVAEAARSSRSQAGRRHGKEHGSGE